MLLYGKNWCGLKNSSFEQVSCSSLAQSPFSYFMLLFYHACILVFLTSMQMKLFFITCLALLTFEIL